MPILSRIINRFSQSARTIAPTDLARTNFIVAGLRDALRGPTEINVKWWYGGAFNGAAWVTQHDNADIFFYRVKPRDVTGISRLFSGGIVVAHVAGLSSAELAQIVASAEAAFEEAWRAEGPTLLSSVARVQFWVWITAESETLAEQALAVFANALHELTDGSVSTSQVFPMPGPAMAWHADLDLSLPRISTHDHVVSELQGALPGLSGSMFGLGTTWNLPAGENRPPLAHIHGTLVTARHR